MARPERAGSGDGERPARRGGTPSGLHWSRHFAERCAERGIEEGDLRHVLERPFVSGPGAEAGVCWHVGRARCGRGSTWHWIKVIESRREGHPTLITSYPLVRRRGG